MKKLYVGNLPFSSSEEDVRELFSQFGQVESVNLIQDRETGRFRGFGFVEMDSENAEDAIASLNGSDFGGRVIKVNKARPRR
jgi:RNA recognition motif-containing protein